MLLQLAQFHRGSQESRLVAIFSMFAKATAVVAPPADSTVPPGCLSVAAVAAMLAMLDSLRSASTLVLFP